MKTLLLTNEYPPHIYGGAGVHVEYLSRSLAKLMAVEVRCFGAQDETQPNLRVQGSALDSSPWQSPAHLRSIFGALARNLEFNTRGIDADLVHLHTWYAHWAGILAKLNYGLPLVLTVHSLEPLRPWKREQLQGGYDFTCWLEKTAIEMADAVIAVSKETRDDILRLFAVDPARVHVIYNGIDPQEYQPRPDPAVLQAHGINPAQPFVMFLGRITRQKGIIHLIRAIEHLDPGFQMVLCAGAADTPEIAAEMQQALQAAQAKRPGIIWIEQMLGNADKIALYSQAALFVCPSIYEPFGIINLEAMACETAVVASAVGGIKEVVRHAETGLLVPLAQQDQSPFEPLDPAAFARDLAAAINELMADPARRQAMAKAGRQRCIEHFSWDSIARQTQQLYQQLCS